jgi:hypothetical protein
VAITKKTMITIITPHRIISIGSYGVADGIVRSHPRAVSHLPHFCCSLPRARLVKSLSPRTNLGPRVKCSAHCPP